MLPIISETPVLAADSLRALEVEDYFALRNIDSTAISPDGEWVAYTVSTQDLAKDSRETRVWIIPTAGGAARPITAKGSSAWDPAWGQDSKHLSFIATGSDSDSSQVFTLDLHGDERVQITHVEGGVEGYEWSPNGKQLALLVRDLQTDTGPGPWIIDRLKFKEDYVGYLNRLRTHLYVFDIDDKSITQITSGDYEDYSPTWSPDGQQNRLRQ